MKIVLICGGPSSEHEVSIASTQAILKNIDRQKYEVWLFYITKDLRSCFYKPEKDFFVPEDPRLEFLPLLDGIKKNLLGVDLAVLMGVHGEFVEDGVLQMLLEYHGIKYTGSDVKASALCMDKYSSTSLVEKVLGVKIPKTFLFDIDQPDFNFEIKYPLVFKPNYAGSSVGVFIIKSQAELEEKITFAKKHFEFRYWLIQEYLEKVIEISCGCLEKKSGEIIELPPIEILPQVAEFFSYEAKYQKGGSKEISPPQNLSSEISAKVSNLAGKIHKLFRCRTYSRSDFLVKDSEIYFLETNTLPGMTETSLLPQEARAFGMNFSELIDFVVQNSS